MSGSGALRRVDWLTVFLFLLLVAIGWVNIYSSTFNETESSIFDMGQLYGKQMVFILLSLGIIPVIMALEASFYERFSSVFYVVSLVLLSLIHI